MKTVLFVPGLFVTHHPYHWIKLPEYAKNWDINLHIHERPAAIAMDRRAEILADAVKKLTDAAGDIHLVGHSAGGRDLRHMLLNRAELAPRIKSVTTIGTPHQGSLIADAFMIKGLEVPCWEQIFDVLNADLAIAKELTTYESIKYNETNKLPVSILKKFYCMPCYAKAKWKCNIASWKGFDTYKRLGLDSDCTVSVGSQIFGEIAKIIEAEHKAATIPIRYGFPGQKIWKRTFQTYFNFLNANFNE